MKKMRSNSVLFCRHATILKKDSIVGGFLYILQNFSEQLFLQNTSRYLNPSSLSEIHASYFSLKKPIKIKIISYCMQPFLFLLRKNTLPVSDEVFLKGAE